MTREVTDGQGSAVEWIDGEPTISLGDALNLIQRIRENFPQWEGLYIPSDSVVEETVRRSVREFMLQARERLGIPLEQSIFDIPPEKLKLIMRASSFSPYWSSKCPGVEELKEGCADDEIETLCLEIDLKYIRVKVKEALYIVYVTAWAPDIFCTDTREQQVAAQNFRKHFAHAMRSIGVEYDPIEIGVMEISKDEEGNRALRTGTFTFSMDNPDEVDRLAFGKLLDPNFLNSDED